MRLKEKINHYICPIHILTSLAKTKPDQTHTAGSWQTCFPSQPQATSTYLLPFLIMALTSHLPECCLPLTPFSSRPHSPPCSAFSAPLTQGSHSLLPGSVLQPVLRPPLTVHRDDHTDGSRYQLLSTSYGAALSHSMHVSFHSATALWGQFTVREGTEAEPGLAMCHRSHNS